MNECAQSPKGEKESKLINQCSKVEVTIAQQFNQGERKKCKAFIETIKKLLSMR
jgi:hypothetical protein